MQRLKHSEIPLYRLKILKEQGGKCQLCGGHLGKGKEPVLDHDHKTGNLRGVLCRNCNGIEGKVFNLANRAKHKRTVREWLTALIEYHEAHDGNPMRRPLHPTFKTEAEKRAARNKKARERRAALKAKGTK